MSEPDERGRTPWHLWVVGVLAVLFNGGGAYDYLMMNLRDPGYLASVPADWQALVFGQPTWVAVAWALAVWGAVVGSVLLLLRRRWAFHAFLVAIAAFIADQLYVLSTSAGAAQMDLAGWGFSVLILGVMAGLAVYSRWMTRRGVLR